MKTSSTIAGVFLLAAALVLMGKLAWKYHQSYFPPLRYHEFDRLPVLVSAETTDVVFSDFFNDTYVLEYRSRFLEDCRVSPRPFILGAVLDRATGFGSVINTAVNVFMLAKEPTINRSFRLYFADWIHPPLSRFLVDFAASSPCPLFEDLNGQEAVLTDISAFELIIHNASQSVELYAGPVAALRWEFGTSWTQSFHAFQMMHQRDGRDCSFSLKSNLARAIWNFRPEYLVLLRSLWERLADETGEFLAIHIRRGDKIDIGEMEDIPVSAYHAKLLEVCLVNKCSRNVFVMSDDLGAFVEFSKLAGAQFRVMNFGHLIAASGRPVEDFVVGMYGQRTKDIDVAKMGMHTQELVLSLTLAAMADHVICTFSSNLGRLIALLRGDPLFGRMHSLDVDWFAL